jgi:hypothetical protein
MKHRWGQRQWGTASEASILPHPGPLPLGEGGDFAAGGGSESRGGFGRDQVVIRLLTSAATGKVHA